MELKDMIIKKLELEKDKYNKKKIRVFNEGDNTFHGTLPLINQEKELISYNKRYDILITSKFGDEDVVNSFDLAEYLGLDINELNAYIKMNYVVVLNNEYKYYESSIDKTSPLTNLSKSWEKWNYNMDGKKPDIKHELLWISVSNANKCISYFRRNNESEVC